MRGMTSSPNYAKITTPKKTLSVPNAYGICVAPNGNFAVISHNGGKKLRLYYSCGKMLKEVDLQKQGLTAATDCAFTERSLYVADHNGRKVFELSTLGEFIRIFATGQSFYCAAACKNRVYFTTNTGGANVLVYDTNGKLIRRI